MKKILYGDEARKAIFTGIDAVNRATACTLGPAGKNAALSKSWGGPTITNDGVSIAREIVLEDEFQDMGAQIVRGVAEKTNDSAGDGTSTSILLTRAIIAEGLKYIATGANVVEIKDGIKKASIAVVEALKAIATPIKNDEETRQVATISAESAEVGKIICDIIKKLGNNGIITVEEGQTDGVVSEITQGLDFEKGFVSPYMITDQEKNEAEYSHPHILVTDQKVTSIQELLPLLEQIMATGKKELVIIAEDVVGDALHNFVINKIRGTFSTLAIKAPGFGERKKDYLQDIAVITGATLISSDMGKTIDKVTMEDLGQASRIISTKDKTTIVGGAGKKKDVDARISAAKLELERTESKHDKIKIEERIGKLSGGVAVIKVGAATETEMKYLKLKIEDAVNATKAALEEGIVPGGGVALLRVKRNVKKPEGLTQDEGVGFNIVLNALGAPLRQIATNGGLGDGSGVLDRVEAMEEQNGGFNALNKTYTTDLIKDGIVDPVKVTRNCIENATSAAGTFLTTDVAVVDAREKKSLDK